MAGRTRSGQRRRCGRRRSQAARRSSRSMSKGAPVAARTCSTVASPSSSVRTSAPSRSRKTESSLTTTSATPRAVERVGALGDDLRLARRRRRGHGHDHPACSDDEIHSTADAENVLPGHRPVRDVACDRDLKGPEHGDVDVPTADHREALRAVEEGGAGECGHRSLRRVDEVGSSSSSPGRGPTPRSPFSVCRKTLAVVEQAGDEIRDTDAEVDDLARSELLRSAGRDRVLTSPVIVRAPARRRTDVACGSTPARARPLTRSLPPRRLSPARPSPSTG